MSKNNKSEKNDTKIVAKLMLGTLWSTTWRIFGPVMVAFGIGLAVDLNTATKPWGMVIGVSVGIVIAIGLVCLQLKDIRSNSLKLQYNDNLSNNDSDGGK